jgi:hypothetical protein
MQTGNRSLTGEARRRLKLRMLTIAMFVAGCAQSTTAPPVDTQPATAPISISSEPSEAVGDVVAAYVTVPISSTRVWALQGLPEALNKSGAPVGALQLEEAIQKAGGEKELLSALSHAPLSAPLVASSAGVLTGMVMFATAVFAVGAPYAIVHSLGRFPHERLEYGLFGCRAGVTGEPGDYWDCQGPREINGYVFFPRDKYVAIQVTAFGDSKTLGIPDYPRTVARCPWR